jgi:hypothetical protein
VQRAGCGALCALARQPAPPALRDACERERALHALRCLTGAVDVAAKKLHEPLRALLQPEFAPRSGFGRRDAEALIRPARRARDDEEDA